MASNLSLKFHEMQEQKKHNRNTENEAKRSNLANEALKQKEIDVKQDELDLRDRINIRDNTTKDNINVRDNQMKWNTNVMDNATKAATSAGLSATHYGFINNVNDKTQNQLAAIDGMKLGTELGSSVIKAAGNVIKKL